MLERSSDQIKKKATRLNRKLADLEYVIPRQNTDYWTTENAYKWGGMAEVGLHFSVPKNLLAKIKLSFLFYLLYV